MTNYAYTIAAFLILSGLLFMLVKQWFKNQFFWVRFGYYPREKKDVRWTWDGWICALIFMSWMASLLLILQFKF